MRKSLERRRDSVGGKGHQKSPAKKPQQRRKRPDSTVGKKNLGSGTRLKEERAAKSTQTGLLLQKQRLRVRGVGKKEKSRKNREGDGMLGGEVQTYLCPYTSRQK